MLSRKHTLQICDSKLSGCSSPIIIIKCHTDRDFKDYIADKFDIPIKEEE